MQQYQHIDPHVLLAAAAEDVEAFADLSNTFLRIAPPMLARLQQGEAAGDHAVSVREAHSLKSTAALIGAARLARMAEDIETQARAGHDDNVRALDGLAHELACVMDEVRTSIAHMRNGDTGAKPA